MFNSAVYTSISVAAGLFLTHGAEAHNLPQAKLAEIALHKVDHLVILKKIDPSFLTKLSTITVRALIHITPGDPAAKVDFILAPPTAGTQKALHVFLAEDGKPFKYSLRPGVEPERIPAWPTKHAFAFAESAIHWILANGSKAEVLPFYKYLSRLEIVLGTNAMGQDLAVVNVLHEVEADEKSPILRIRVKFDGTFDSSEVISPSN